jgi:hypothetical protein
MTQNLGRVKLNGKENFAGAIKVRALSWENYSRLSW